MFIGSRLIGIGIAMVIECQRSNDETSTTRMTHTLSLTGDSTDGAAVSFLEKNV